MGVRGVSGQEPAALVPSSIARTPSPRPRAADPDEGTKPEIRAGPGPKEEQVQRAANRINQDPAVTRSGVRLRIDKASKRIVAQIVNQNNEVIKQIPPEELLKVAANVRRMLGLLFDQEV